MPLLTALSLLLGILIAPCTAKFEHSYKGIATEGIQACINSSTFTAENITLRDNCGDAFACIMSNISSQKQSILSSGSGILAFVPTVLLVLGTSNEDVIRISARFPLLAFFLALATINKRPQLTKLPSASPRVVIDLGPYGAISEKARTYSPPTAFRGVTTTHVGIVVAHIATGAGAAVVVWRTIDLGVNAVVTWACWTDFYPMVWLLLAVVHHIAAVVFVRLTLKITPCPTRSVNNTAQGIATATARVPISALRVWDLQQQNCTVICAHTGFAKLSKAGLDLLNNATYLYGTAIFSSLTMVSGHNAIKVLCTYSGVAVASRIAAVWVLEEIGGAD
ncbi:hypothetical protein C7974DRAFT_193026 [Boeremia exigua]|uniref:uncharacterized protein n=1 Tax=Boeremia exigua TaxID=749465 RepID=UPI001E8D3440|nr:uncharacterized protein C7974DRAFT_193026 [Boeremia exigua]KAH6629788.1 hypothetical protein C7974DRAFT_193026 [Boeremia exigua]